LNDVLIIGSGPSGLTAGIYASRANLSTVIFSGKQPGGQLMLTSEVENFPGFPEGVLGPELMEKMKSQAARFGAQVLAQTVTKVDFSKRPFKIWTGDEEYEGRGVSIATGADTVWLGVPGEEKLVGKGVSSCANCDAFFYRGKKAAVVGGGDSAMEEALTLAKFADEVTIIHRRDIFKASKIMQGRVLNHPKVKVLWNSEVVAVLGENKVEGIVVKNLLQSTPYNLSVNGLFVAIGHKPNTKIFEGQLELDEKGYVKKEVSGQGPGVSNFQMATSVGGVFVAGDVHDHHYKQAVTAAAFGCMSALEVEKWLNNY
jgi:thioredoxin reductase (NADPH)